MVATGFTLPGPPTGHAQTRASRGPTGKIPALPPSGQQGSGRGGGNTGIGDKPEVPSAAPERDSFQSVGSEGHDKGGWPATAAWTAVKVSTVPPNTHHSTASRVQALHPSPGTLPRAALVLGRHTVKGGKSRCAENHSWE